LKFKARIMRHTGDIWKNHPCCVIVAAQPFIDQHPVVIQKAITAIVRAQIFCRAHPRESAHMLSRDGKGYLPVPEEVVLRVFQKPLPEEVVHKDWDIPRIDFQPYPYPSATRFIIEQMKQTRVEGDTEFLMSLDSDQATAELVDDRFVLKALDDVGGMRIFCNCDMDMPYTREEIVEIG
jgi:NitT/TauT family transport system substrate-binding protein